MYDLDKIKQLQHQRFNTAMTWRQIDNFKREHFFRVLDAAERFGDELEKLKKQLQKAAH